MLTDFVTTYNSELSTIDLMTRIEFPGRPSEMHPIVQFLVSLVSHISQMTETIVTRLAEKADEAKPGKQPGAVEQTAADRFSEESARIMDCATTKLARQENQLAQLLSDWAIRTGLSTDKRGEPKHDRHAIRPTEK